MELKIYANKPVLYKNGNHCWRPGVLSAENVKLTNDGLTFTVINYDGSKEMGIRYEELFLDAQELQDWEQDPKNGVLFTIDEFIQKIEDEEIDARSGLAYVSDGHYKYYPVSKFTANWIRKQPFDYIVWYE